MNNPTERLKISEFPHPKGYTFPSKGISKVPTAREAQNSDLLKILQPVVDYQYSWHGPVDWANWEKEHVNRKNLWKTQINFPAKDKIYPPANL